MGAPFEPSPRSAFVTSFSQQGETSSQELKYYIHLIQVSVCSELLAHTPVRNTWPVGDHICVQCFVFGLSLFGQDTVSRVSEVSAFPSHPLLRGRAMYL